MHLSLSLFLLQLHRQGRATQISSSPLFYLFFHFVLYTSPSPIPLHTFSLPSQVRVPPKRVLGVNHLSRLSGYIVNILSSSWTTLLLSSVRLFLPSHLYVSSPIPVSSFSISRCREHHVCRVMQPVRLDSGICRSGRLSVCGLAANCVLFDPYVQL